jgi:DNA helicase II / ATP-dependent DNA helicase PcrA
MQSLSFWQFFDNADHNRSRGRGFSLFNAAPVFALDFLKMCQKSGFATSFIQTSHLQAASLEPSDVVVILQDLPHDEFLGNINRLVNQAIFPAWHRRTCICFFSELPKDAYAVDSIPSGLLHNSLQEIERLLILEQLLGLLERTNLQFLSPELMDLKSTQQVYTPIEAALKEAMEAEGLSFVAQARLGKYVVDFLVEGESAPLIVECDGREYHAPERDAERDQALALYGFYILHFTGAEIFSDAQNCVQRIRAVQSHGSTRYSIDSNLDASQKPAVVAMTGPVRVLAPAGSGKTKTLTNRILHLLNSGVHAEQVLALAFNTRARDEMQLRLEGSGVTVARSMGQEGVAVRTFHSLGYEIVREGLGWTFQQSTADQVNRSALRGAVQQHYQIVPRRNVDPLESYLEMLWRTKMGLLPTSGSTVEVGDNVQSWEPIFQSYLDRQTQAQVMTFDDMIYLAVRVLLENPELRRRLQNRFRYVLVDEFQDLNEAQLLMLHILWLPDCNVFVVGDDDQMIYGWRGAEVRHILDFPKRFGVASDFTLSVNYRSSKAIVRHSAWLISHNQNRVRKDIHPVEQADEGSVELLLRSDLWDQARSVANSIAKRREAAAASWRDFAVLFRLNAEAYPVALALDEMSIPHSAIDPGRLFSTPVGRDVLAYFTVTCDPTAAEPEQFERILKRPNKYITNALASRARDWMSFQALTRLSGLRQWEERTLYDFVERIRGLQSLAAGPTTTARGLLDAIEAEVQLRNLYADQSSFSSVPDAASDETVFEVIRALARRFSTPTSLLRFASDALSSGGTPTEENYSRNEVHLSTIHRSKGREFKNVAYFNLSPLSKGSADFEEERRVTYVGVTRAISSLAVSFNQGTRYSQFLSELMLNPGLASMSVPQLKARQSGLDSERLRSSAALARLESSRARLLSEYPELHGESKPLRFSSLLTEWRLRRRERAVESKILEMERLGAERLKHESSVEAVDEERSQIAREIETRTLLKAT